MDMLQLWSSNNYFESALFRNSNIETINYFASLTDSGSDIGSPLEASSPRLPTIIFNSSLREGKLPDLWKTATIVPVPKKHPPGSLENDIRPISLTPILAKVFEGIVLNWVDDVITPFRGISRHRYDGRLGGDGPHVVRGYR